SAAQTCAKQRVRYSRGLLHFAAFSREHQPDQLFSDFRLEPFSVSLVNADDVGHDPAFLAVRVDVDLSLARRRQQSPGRIGWVLTRAVVDIAGFRVADLFRFAPRGAGVFPGPVRSLRQPLVIHLALARLVDEREIAGRRLAQGGHRRTYLGGSCRTATAAGRASRGSTGGRWSSASSARARRAETRRASRVASQTATRQAEPAVNPLLKEVSAQEPVRGQAALRVPDQPERPDVLPANLLDDRIDDVLQVLVVVGRPRSRRRVRCSDHKAILVHVVHDREVVPLPVPVGAEAMKTEDEGDFLALLQVARIIEEIRAAGLHLDHGAGIYHPVSGAVFVGTVQDWGRGAGCPRKFEGLLGAGINRERHNGATHRQQSDQIERLFHLVSSYVALMRASFPSLVIVILP